jgi:hypothetical protein
MIKPLTGFIGNGLLRGCNFIAAVERSSSPATQTERIVPRDVFIVSGSVRPDCTTLSPSRTKGGFQRESTVIRNSSRQAKHQTISREKRRPILHITSGFDTIKGQPSNVLSAIRGVMFNGPIKVGSIRENWMTGSLYASAVTLSATENEAR